MGLLCFVAVIATATEITSTIEGQLGRVPADVLKKNAARISLNGDQLVYYSRRDGSFVLPQLQPGSYLMEIGISNFVFPPIWIDVSPTGVDKFRVIKHDGSGRVLASTFHDEDLADETDEESGTSKKPSKQTKKRQQSEHAMVVIDALGQHQYYVPREAFSMLSMLKNPTVLIMGVTMLMAFVMPKIANQDEMRKQMKELQNAGKQVAKP